MKKKQREIIEHFEKELTEQTRSAAEEPEDQLLGIIEEQIDYKKGVELYLEYAERVGVPKVEPLARDYLLFSLLQSIPGFANLNKSMPVVRIRGLQFSKKLNKVQARNLKETGRAPKVVVMGRYIESVRTAIDNVIKPKYLDVQKAMGHSGDYFFNRLRNLACYAPSHTIATSFPGLKPNDESAVLDVFVKHLFSEEEYKKLLTSKPFSRSNPLIEVSTGKSLTKELNIDPRLLLNTLFGLDEDGVFSKAKQILFSHLGVFYLDEGEVKLMPANEGYEKLFFLGNKDDLKEQRGQMLKLPRKSDDMDKFEENFRENVQAIVQNKCKGAPLSTFEVMVNRIKDEFGIEIVGTADVVGYVPVLRDERNQKILFDFLGKVHKLMPGVIESLRISAYRDAKIDINDRKEVALHASQLNHKLRSPRYLSRFLNRDYLPNRRSKQFDEIGFAEPDITLQDLELLAKYPEYEKVVFHFILVGIFKSNISKKRLYKAGCLEGGFSYYDYINREMKLEPKNDAAGFYDAFKDAVGVEQINKEQHQLQSYGFQKNSELSEIAVLINYFAVFGGMYIQEELSWVPNKALPDKLREFFRVYLSKKEPEVAMLEKTRQKLIGGKN